MIKQPNSSPIDALVDLACRDGVDVRPTLLRVLTDLYVQKPTHSADEETQYLELALGLIDAVDEPTRAAVANSLSTYPAAPAAILQRLGVAAMAAPAPRAAAGPDNLRETFFGAGSARTPLYPAQSRSRQRKPHGASRPTAKSSGCWRMRRFRATPANFPARSNARLASAPTSPRASRAILAASRSSSLRARSA